MTDRVRHLWSRAGMGIPLGERDFTSEKELLDHLINDAQSIQPLPGTPDAESLTDLLSMTPEEKAKLIKTKAIEIRQLNFEWMMRLAENKGILREKLTLFWTNHFSCRSGSPEFTRQLNQIIRENALGSFKTLLLEVSRSPAMLQFLNNQQNRKSHPNENFAREVMELFTIGRGNYTEKDISEAARAFTGWSFDKDGSFVFRERVHDDNVKTILGETGHFNGEDVINILLRQKSTAGFVVTKFWKAFVSDELDRVMIEKLSDEFYHTDYDILKLVKSVFGSEWFYQEKYKGAIIKSPVELMIPLIRDFNVKFANINVLLGFQKVLGQILFNPPNVAGWPGGRNWIDSSSLAVRMRLALVFTRDLVPEFNGKEDADANNPFKDGVGQNGSKVESDWSQCYKQFAKVKSEDLLYAISGWLLAVPLTEKAIVLSGKYINGEGKEERMQSVVTFLTGLPEYQLC